MEHFFQRSRQALESKIEDRRSKIRETDFALSPLIRDNLGP
jgi:hypothetical protein